jgi:hypothetical protein
MTAGHERSHAIRSGVNHIGKSSAVLDSTSSQSANLIDFAAAATFRCTGVEIIGEDGKARTVSRAAPHPARAYQKLSGILRVENKRYEQRSGVSVNGCAGNHQAAVEILRAAIHSGSAALDTNAGIRGELLGRIVGTNLIKATVPRIHICPTNAALGCAGGG